ncbi:hypothetical protein [Acetobacter tropicalis]|uniref:Uncharacterized protein n=1 Tax=Acetobacter tropicalis TaxID=104102 RepID=A0A291PJL1_9PROT|nr:hypothetical protein [Acetobacter tropicalis]ATJ91578.1 hypothetical protein CIW82_13610 [Acetobacter tropicalis]
MRTREEQIAALAFKIGGVQASNATKQSAEAHILEAERRAEQRVRAEIGRDSERLDWLEKSGKTGIRLVANEEEEGGIVLDDDCLGDFTASTVREAIDAAREVG